MLLLLLACTDPEPEATPPLPDAVLDALSMARVRDDVDQLAGDDFAGRTPGSAGHARAQALIVERMQEIGLEPLGEDYALPFPLELDDDRYEFDEQGQVVPVVADTGWNLAGLLPGASRPEELIVLMAHYDHLGVNSDGEVFNGAYDDITGVAALLEMARVFVDEGVQPERSLLFLITDAEEGGLNGSEAFVVDPLLSLDEVVFALSVDPIGRPLLPEYMPLILLGLERSPELLADWEALSAYSEVDVAFVNRDPIPIFGSDQDSFWALDEPAPAVWFTSPGMSFYHTVEDSSETIDYRSVRAHLRFLAQAIAWFGDDDARYVDLGEQPLSTRDAQHGVTLLDGALATGRLDEEETTLAERMRREFQQMVDTGEIPDDAGALYVQTAFFLLFDLTRAHPGEVPPPWPEGE
ncbi:MAG: M20/M25/M40 family metallo-hydrolase [Alphaproteobacteria bacterium]|nr:M20/M25/M40 family metallo-hydrolase [Alphaproteobacteria bacterium]